MRQAAALLGVSTTCVRLASAGERVRDARRRMSSSSVAQPPVAQAVEDADEGGVLLPEDALQGCEPELARLEAGRLEEPRAAIALLQDVLDIGADHGRQLVQVARQDHAHAAEGLPVAAIEAQRIVDRLHHVGAHHGDLVDHHGLDRFHHALVADLARVACIEQARREIEEGMDRLAADIHRGEAGGREHDGFLERVEDQLAQQRRLPRAGAAGEEDVALARRRSRRRSGW